MSREADAESLLHYYNFSSKVSSVQGFQAALTNSSPIPSRESDQAVDESSDVDGDFAELQKMLSQKRRAAKDSPESRLRQALPFITEFVPFIRPLTISDLDSCIALENALGIFLTVIPERANDLGIQTLPHAKPVETGRADGAVSVLLAHIVSSRCSGDIVTDSDMDYPKDWRSRKSRAAEVGHQASGKTVGLHSLAVLPRLQQCGIGQMIMKAYLDQMRSYGVVNRVALICQDHLVSYYERFGFKHLGESKAQFGGGGWHDMEFIDIVLSFTQETCSEKFGQIVSSFPVLTDQHPFHRDLMNILYDADHFKVALGQVSTAKHLIETICRDYVRLLKYAQSLYQCKQLKRAALGRMATLIKRLKDPLQYLDQVRQHLARLPDINPTTRTLLVAGFPNVGKSSFVRSVTRADTPVEPYAFFVGHLDYKYLRYQVIDTPGILDHPLEEMNTIEMQSVTALAHLRAAVLFFIDISEQCGYSLSAQCNLFRSIKPLFANKMVFIVLNKMDIKAFEDLEPEMQAELQDLTKSGDVELLRASCATQDGVQDVKNHVCERLLAERVSQKLKAGTASNGALGSRLSEVMARIHVAQPMDGVTRETFIPEAVKSLKKYDKNDPERRILARDVEEANGGAGVYNVDLRKDYILADPSWKYDKIPEIYDGKNVYDYVDPDIDAKLAALEEEEERLEKEGFYESDSDIDDESEEEVLQKAEYIREKHKLIRNEAKMRKSLKNRAIIPRKNQKRPFSQLEDHLDQLGVDTESIGLRARSQVVQPTRGRSVTRSRAGTADPDAMDVDEAPSNKQRLRSASRARSVAATNRREDGVQDATARTAAERQAKLSQRKMNRMARQGEADRHIAAAMPKHLFSGKRTIGKTSRR
ncbi:putative nucleolar GTP-binding protein 1 [Achaetomium macrosporum]|uniref:Nucleolar GTP-binding protein 1 n=1 Tax=Achaetomium macrosporum TaxID=79813 RepID=A0AAN7CAD2_9PEZI|nr:putative nucleolar GTP-binding protein 1 [Achaetomium macrosporum]